MIDTILKSIRSLKEGKMILLFDAEDREGETDLVIPAMSASRADVFRMRRDGGGLMCVAVHPVAAKRLGLPFISDLLRSVSGNGNNGYSALKNITEKKGDIPYDSRSSFSLWVNHRNTFTGITDNDRTLTINRLGKTVQEVMTGKTIDFGKEFRSPGHVALLRAADRLVDERAGQTELSIALADMSGIVPAMVVCEMLDGNTGKALSKSDAITYAKENSMVFVEGKDVIAEYHKFFRNCSS